jgi:hypothetical protein
MKMNVVKKLYASLALAFLGMMLHACNDEWKDEQYEKSVSFVKSAGTQVTDVYLKYQKDGTAPYKIPIVVSGSTGNDRDVQVAVSVFTDTIEGLNKGRFHNQENLYFKLLEDSYYAFPNGLTATIPAGENVGLLDINFTLSNLDLTDKYLLPLKIESTSAYAPSTKRGYNTMLMRIIPFNDYSGIYRPVDGQILLLTDGSDGKPMKRDTLGTYEEEREARVVDDSTVFFYAGLVQELDSTRADYKITMKFLPEGTLELKAENDSIKLQGSPNSKCTYELLTTTDEMAPYLIRRYTVIKLNYMFYDRTNPIAPLHYWIKCTMRMERVQNTLIPEEDQQFIFE